MEDSNYSYTEVTDTGLTKGLMVLSGFPQNQNRTRIDSFSNNGGKYKIMYIDGYINIHKTGIYRLNINGTRAGYKIWINGIPYIEKFPTSTNSPRNSDPMSLLENNFYHFEIVIFNGNNYYLSGTYFNATLVNEEDATDTQNLKLYKEGINPWCGKCIKCGACTTEGQIREGCGIDGGPTQEYNQGTCSNCGSCDASGTLNSA